MQNTEGYMELIIRMNFQAGAPACHENKTDDCATFSEFGSINRRFNQSQLYLPTSFVPGKYTYFQACATGVCIPENLCRDPARYVHSI